MTLGPSEAALPADLPPADHARASLRAVGTGYLRFAQAETGLFRTAFGPSDDLTEPVPDPERAGQSGLNPFELLTAALDRLVAAGPLGPVIGAQMEQVGQRLLDLVEKGL